MNAKLVYLKPQTVMFVRSQGKHAEASSAAWTRIFKWLEASKLLASKGCGYGLSRAAQPAMHYDACIELPQGVDETNLPEDFGIQRVAGGAYVCQPRVGASGDLRESIDSLRKDWETGEFLAFDPSRPVIERYTEDPAKCAADERVVELYLPVTTRTDFESAA